MSTQRHTIHIHFGFPDDPVPTAELSPLGLPTLDLGDHISLVGSQGPAASAWLRKLATVAEELADANDITARRATFRITEVFTDETRDVPTPGAAG